MQEPYLDEDLIPAFKCVRCKAHVCKDEVGKSISLEPEREALFKGYACVCINCLMQEL